MHNALKRAVDGMKDPWPVSATASPLPTISKPSRPSSLPRCSNDASEGQGGKGR